QNGFLKMLSQPVAHIVEALRRVANPKLRNRLRIQSAPGQILTRTRRLGRLQRLLKVLRRRFVDLHQLPALARIPGLFGRMKLLLRQRHPNLLCDRPHCLRKAEAVHLHDERKNVAGLVAPEAVIKPLRHIHRKAARLLLMKWAQAREVLRPRLAQLHIVADDANNVGLVLYLLRETISHGRLTSLVLLKNEISSAPSQHASDFRVHTNATPALPALADTTREQGERHDFQPPTSHRCASLDVGRRCSRPRRYDVRDPCPRRGGHLGRLWPPCAAGLRATHLPRRWLSLDPRILGVRP